MVTRKENIMSLPIGAENMARTAYRAMFKEMAMGGQWNLCQGLCNVVLLRDEETEDRPVLVHNVQAMCEERFINAVHNLSVMA